MALLGFSGQAPKDKRLRKALNDAWVDQKITARNEARKAKNFAEADRIRDELLKQNIILKDGPTGTTWEIKR
jgi:cysteinyl-tRNA synthetase